MRRLLGALAAVACVATGACAGDGGPAAPGLERAATTAAPPGGSTSTSSSVAAPGSTSPAPSTSPSSTTSTVAAAGGSGAEPDVAREPVALAAQLVAAETAVRDPSTPLDELAAAAHVQQVAYRRLGRHPEWDAAVTARVPAALHPVVAANVAARREFASMHARPVSTVPAWRIVEPPPADDLLAWYVEGERTFGVPWYYLAAVNLVETGFGRIRGTSVAGAQGPMQFLPSTWAAFGEGDIEDPHDAILAAARYLAHNGAPVDMPGALWNYNHAWPYVRGVMHLAHVMRDHTQAFHGYYHWQIYLSTTSGDVLLPVGYELHEPMPVAEWLRRRSGD